MAACLRSFSENKTIADAYLDFKCYPDDEIIYVDWGFNGVSKGCKSGWGSSVAVDYGYIYHVANSNRATRERVVMFFDSNGVEVQRVSRKLDDNGKVIQQSLNKPPSAESAQ